MLDAQLIAACIADRAAYDKVAPHMHAEDFTPPGAFWWKLVGEWYGRDRGTKAVDLASLTSLGSSRIGNPKLRDAVLGFIGDLPAAVSSANAAAVALSLKRYNIGMELASAIASGDEKKQAKLVPQFAELRAATELHSKRSVKYELAEPIETLWDTVGQEHRVPLAPSRLNSRIGGGALPGHHVVLFGRPESGKSTFSINFACQAACKANQRVLYVGNEDQIDVLKARAVGRVCGLTSEEIDKDRAKAIDVYRERGGEERLQFVQMFDGGADDLRQPIEEFEPTVLVLDQIRNLTGDGDGIVQRLDENGQAVRRLLLEYSLIGLSITQASVSAEGKEWLTMEDLDSSKTGLPGTADLLVGLGGNAATFARGQRTLSFPKNKLSSAQNAHEGMLVEIDMSRSKLR